MPPSGYLRRAAETSELYGALVESSADFISISDLEGKVVYVNSAGRALLEIGSLDEAKETLLLDYFVAAERERVQREIMPAVEREGRWSGSIQMRNFKTGRPVPLDHNVVALTDVDGRRIGVGAVSRDVRDRQRVEDGLRLLARTGAAVVDLLDYQRTLRNIARAFIDGFAAYCLIDVIPPGGTWERTAMHRDPSRLPVLTELSRPQRNHPITRAIEDGTSAFMPIDENWANALEGPVNDRLDAIRVLRVRSIITVPVATPTGDIVGALTCALDESMARDDYDADDLGFVQEVGRRVGSAIANTKLYERERRIAVELQSASLPQRVPEFPGVHLDAAYRPGGTEASVGGDWYDAFVLADKRLAITVGDVIGHGLTAAVSMTKLRLAMQSAARVDPDPNVMLRVADEVIVSRADRYATAVAAIYDPATRVLTYASAGHPGPVTRTPQGNVEDSSAPGIMLGLRHGASSETRAIQAPPGTTMVFFTDGLVEVTRDMDEGYGRLFGALADPELPRAAHPAEALVELVLGEDVPRDDIAVLVLSFD